MDVESDEDLSPEEKETRSRTVAKIKSLLSKSRYGGKIRLKQMMYLDVESLLLWYFSVKSMDAEQIDFSELNEEQERVMSIHRALATEASIKRKQVTGETLSSISGNIIIEYFILIYHTLVILIKVNFNVLFCSQSHVWVLRRVEKLSWEPKIKLFCVCFLYLIHIYNSHSIIQVIFCLELFMWDNFYKFFTGEQYKVIIFITM